MHALEGRLLLVALCRQLAGGGTSDRATCCFRGRPEYTAIRTYQRVLILCCRHQGCSDGDTYRGTGERFLDCRRLSAFVDAAAHYTDRGQITGRAVE